MRTLALLVFLGCAAATQAQAPKTYTPDTPPRPNEETILNAQVVAVDVAANRLTVRGVDVKADGGRNETFSVAAPATSRLSELKHGMEVLLTLRGTTVVDVKVSVTSGGQGGQVVRGSGTATKAAAPATIGIAPTTRGGTSPQGTITLQGSPAPAVSPAPRSSRASGRAGRTAPRPAVTPRPTVTPVVAAPVTGAAPATVVIVPVASPAPVPTATPPVGAPTVTGAAPVGGVIYIAPPSPVPAGTPFPTPRPVPTPVPVGTPRPVPTPIPVLVPSEPPTPTPSPQMP